MRVTGIALSWPEELRSQALLLAAVTLSFSSSSKVKWMPGKDAILEGTALVYFTVNHLPTLVLCALLATNNLETLV